MKLNRRTMAAGAGVLALAAGGAGIAYGVGGGESEEQVTGPDAKRAAAAAVDSVGGGTVAEVEYQEAEGTGLYEVEVVREDGSQVEVHLNGSYEPLGTVADDDGTAGEADEAGEND